jgi:hypothetical protein
MSLYSKLPRYLLGKYQLIGTVTFSVLFAIVFLNIYIPFSQTAWFGLGNSVTFIITLIFIAVAILTLIVSRMLMYQTSKHHEIRYITYIAWCLAEILIISGLYTWITVNLPSYVEETTFITYSRSAVYCSIALGIPFLISGMYFAIIDKNNTIRLMNFSNVVTEDSETLNESKENMHKITLFDNSGTLKLSISPDNLYYIESDDNYIKVWYTDSKGNLKQYMLRCRLKTVEESFKGSGLIRCNRKYIVNIKKVSMLRKESEGYVLDLDNESIPTIPVTKTYTDSILSYFTDESPLLEPIDE